jgi:hypothetical protein
VRLLSASRQQMCIGLRPGSARQKATVRGRSECQYRTILPPPGKNLALVLRAPLSGGLASEA